jgi:hypothetical protein
MIQLTPITLALRTSVTLIQRQVSILIYYIKCILYNIFNAKGNEVAITLAGMINTKRNSGNAFKSDVSNDVNIQISTINGANIAEFFSLSHALVDLSDR